MKAAERGVSGNARPQGTPRRSAAEVNAEFEAAVQAMVREYEASERKRRDKLFEKLTGLTPPTMTKKQAASLAEAMELVKKDLSKARGDYDKFGNVLAFLAGALAYSDVPYICVYETARAYCS